MPDSRSGAREAVAAHISDLNAACWKMRWQAAQTLGELKDKRAVKPLESALNDANRWVRIVAAEALGQIESPRAAPALVSALSDESIWVRRASVVALGQIGDAGAISPLMKRLLAPPHSDWPEELLDTIAKALGAIGGSTLNVLIDALEDPDPWVCCAAARALGQIGDPKAIIPLTALTKRKQSWVRSAATHALAQISDARAVRAALTTAEAPDTFWKMMALREIDESTIKQLTSLLDDPDERVRTQAAVVLGRLNDERSTASLASALRIHLQPTSWRKASSQKAALRTTAQTERDAKHTERLANEQRQDKFSGVHPLIDALSDPVAEVRLAAAEALGKIGDVSAIPALQQTLQDSDGRVRAAAAWSLGEIRRPLR